MRHGGTWYAKRRKKADMRRAVYGAIAIYGSIACILIAALVPYFQPKIVEAAYKPEIVTVEKPVIEQEAVPETIEQIIERKAFIYGVDAEYAKKISFCESSNKPNAVNWQGSSASGLYMFTTGTWQDGLRWRGLDWSLDDRFDAEKSTDMAMWFVAKEGWGRWACAKLVK